MVMTEDEKRMTAYHEAGHAIVSVHEPASDPIHKATIIPRGRALGMVMRLPERDSYSYHRDKMYANLAVAMGGRVAEEVIFGYDKVSSGASRRHPDGDRPRARHGHQMGHVGQGRPGRICPAARARPILGYSASQPARMSNETARVDRQRDQVASSRAG